MTGEKFFIRGAAVELEIEAQFNSELSKLKELFKEAEARGDMDKAAFILALAYLAVELQD